MLIRLTAQQMFDTAMKIENNDGRLSADSSADLDYAWDTLEDFVKTFDKLTEILKEVGIEFFYTPLGMKANNLLNELEKGTK